MSFYPLAHLLKLVPHETFTHCKELFLVHFRRTGTLRPRTGGREDRPGQRGGKMKRKPPKVKVSLGMPVHLMHVLVLIYISIK